MKAISALAIMYLVVGCTTTHHAAADNIMDLIESQVQLPNGAKLSAYARHYALDETGFVIGVYTPGYSAPDPNATCTDLLADMTSREVPCGELGGDRLLAGQRQWVDNTEELPLIHDGGCSVITVVYDPKAAVVKSATCNGVA